MSRVRVGALWRRLTLWPRLVIAVTLGFGALFALVSLLALRAVDASTDRILRERLVVAQSAAAELDRALERSTRQLTASIQFGPPGRALSDEHILAHVRLALGSTVLSVYFLDGHGRVLRAEPPGTVPPGGVTQERFVRQVLATGRPAISDVFRHVSGKPAVAIAVPARKGTPVNSILVGVLDMQAPDVVGVLLQAPRLGKTGHGELVGPGGVVIASTEPDDYLKPGEHLAFYREMLRSPEPGVENVPYHPWHAVPGDRRDERHVMAFARLKAAPWGVAVGGLDTETLAPVEHLKRTLLLAGAGSLAALWLLTLLGARLLVRPVLRLTAAAREMAGGDLEQTVAVSEGGEIGVLAESLETMRTQLRESLETIRRWGEELEATVEVRTAELSMRNRQLAAVTAVANAAHRARDLDGVIRSCLEAILDHAELDGAAVRLASGDEGSLGEAVTAGAYGDFPCHKLAIWPGECPCGVVFEDRSGLHSVVPMSFDPSCPRGALSMLPLRTRKGLLGVLSVTRAHGPFRPDERSALAAIADQLAITVENAQLVEEIAAIEAQREVQRMKAELISSVSHELRTPLGFVKSYATTLLRDDAGIDAETRRQFLEVIDEETGKLERMIGELLDASRLQAGRLLVELEPVMVGALVERAVAVRRPALAETGHAVVLRLPHQDVEVLADPLRIEEILDNLLQNAARYSDAGAQVEVNVVSDDDSVLITVRDHGDGVPEEDRERVFESFYRGEAARARRSRGIGLGLAICRGLVEAQNGRIWVEGASGGGAVFLVSLPLAPAQTADTRPGTQSLDHSQHGGIGSSPPDIRRSEKPSESDLPAISRSRSSPRLS